MTISEPKSSSEAKSIADVRLRVQKQPQKLLSSTAAPWYLQPKVMVPFVTIHVLAGIGVIHPVSAFMLSYGN